MSVAATACRAVINPLDLTGRRILVTGASSGIGRGTAIFLSQLGATLVVSGRDEERLQATIGMLHGVGHQAAPFDLADLDAIPKWIKQLAQDGGVLHGVAHCAGLQVSRPVRVIDAKFIDTILRVNVSAAIMLARGFRQRGCHGEGGALVFVASTSSLAGQATNAVYCASKGGLVTAVKALALELAVDGIRVNCVSPGLVETEMCERFREVVTQEQFDSIKNAYPLGVGQPEDVAQAIAFLLAGTARWITGTNLLLDGGTLAGG
ncbi:SDR family oxidoreductase [Acetobacter lambici]|uniref:SDR family oxidoreductase n=1 Tax=Acetobacter lambici TaxID=1332824 RepID=A0ABT1EY91_9PROT|nr:SDR family oxidoreductase [Acetobacter lambici]MCP1241728.1 SDR family oxidoreductase [Acetobacter lambici]MCP1257853.1 SDR family oxidoreductase [Acetobacter lambici]NHO56561.1 SDR family oxidoreductase [Acetobacter lambici]